MPSHEKISFKRALDILQTCIPKNSQVRKQILNGQLRNEDSLVEMREFLDKCCISQENLTGLRVIHVAGTKGKGSTCAYLERLCRSVGLKTGLFCSPHLISSRERIKINGIPLTKEQFSHTFSKVWQPFSQSEARPGYFRMLTLMAFEAFIGSQVDVAIFEVGIGGRFDPTNVVERPAVTAITSLALEHTDMLGNSIQTIAWHKSGIIKCAAPILSVTQCDEASQLISLEAAKAKSRLSWVENSFEGVLDWPNSLNASLATATFIEWLRLTGNLKMLPTEARMLSVIQQTRIPGRQQILEQEGVKWFLDGAHTAESVQATTNWFIKHAPQEDPKSLLFYCSENRDADGFLKILEAIPFNNIFLAIPNENSVEPWGKRTVKGLAPIGLKSLLAKHQLHGAVLVTGSFYLVGGVLEFLNIPIESL